MINWSSYEKYNSKNVSNINAVYGVYKLAVLRPENKKRVFYIGSGNIKERLTAHLSDSEPNTCISNKIEKYACFFSFKEIQGGEEKRKKEEQELIKKYQAGGNAECNKVDST